MADRYWVGGTDTWNDDADTKWASSSGGAGGESAPTILDNVFFDANSGSGVITFDCPTVARTCLDLDFSGFTGTITNTTNCSLRIDGNITLDSGMTTIFDGIAIIFTGSGSYTFTSNGAILDNTTGALATIQFEGLGSSWTFVDNLYATYFQLALTDATFVFNADVTTYLITMGDSPGGADTSVTFGSGTTLNISGILITPNFSHAFSLSSSNTNLNMSPTAGVGDIQVNSIDATFNNVIIYGGIFSVFSDTGQTLTLNNLTLSPGSTLVVAPTTFNFVVGNLIADGSIGNQILIYSNETGVPANISANTTSLSYVTVTDMTALGGGIPFIVTIGGINGGGNTNWSFLTPLSDLSQSGLNLTPGVRYQLTFDGLVFGAPITVYQGTQEILKTSLFIYDNDEINISEDISVTIV